MHDLAASTGRASAAQARHQLRGVEPVAAILAIDVATREVLQRSALFTDATFSQPALRAQGALTGVAVMLALAYLLLRRRADVLAALAARDTLSRVVFAMVPAAVFFALVGFLRGNDLVFVVGDTYKVLVVPAVFLVTAVCVRGGAGLRKRVLALYVVVAALAAALLAGTFAGAIAEGRSTFGLGAPPTVLLASLVAFLAVAPRRSRRMTLVACAALLVLLVMALLSLSRGYWIVAAGSLLAGAVLAPRELRVRGVLVLVIMGFAVAGASMVLPRDSYVVTQVRARVDDLTGRTTGPPTMVPPKDVVNSVDERRWEVSDALTHQWREGGWPAEIVGMGSGAEYPTALPRIEGTSRAGYRHQLHVTWVTAWFRWGLAGFALLVAAVAAACLAAARGLRGSSGSDRILWATLVIWFVVSAVGLVNAYGFFGEISWAVMLGLAASGAGHARGDAAR